MSEWDKGEKLASEKELREQECEMYKSVGRRRVEVNVYGRVLCRQRVVSREADLEILERPSQAVPLRLRIPWWQSITSRAG